MSVLEQLIKYSSPFISHERISDMSFVADDDNREQGSDIFPPAPKRRDRSSQSLSSILPLVVVLVLFSRVSKLSKLPLVGVELKAEIVIALLAAAAACRRISFSCLYSEYFSCTVFAILPKN